MAYRLGAVKPHVTAAANYFGPKYGIKTVYGWGPGSVPNSDHPKGLALDFMTKNKAVGDALAADLVSNAGQWAVKYIIWYRREWSPSKGWHDYHGSPNPHTDHVHVSFNAKPGAGGATADPGVNVLPTNNPVVPDSIEKLSDFLTDNATWRKAALYTLGAGMILSGVVLLTVGSLPGTGTMVKLVTKVVK